MPVFYNACRHCFVFTNLKVMYSTLTLQDELVQRSADRVTDKEAFARLLLRKVGLGPASFLLIRNPYARAVSFFADKFRRHPALEQERGFADFDGWQACQRMFFAPLSIDATQSPGAVSRALQTVSFGDMVAVLPTLYRQDPHLRPQHEIETVFWRGLPQRVTFDGLVPIEQMNPALMLDRLGVNVEQRRNRTQRDPYTSHLTPDILATLNALYEDDFARFGYCMHDRVPEEPVLAPVRPSSSFLTA